MTNTGISKALYETYRKHMHKLADVRSALALMQWDQETYMPPKGSGFRAQQVSTLSEIAHELATDEKLGNMLESMLNAPSLTETERRNVLLNQQDFEKQKKYSPAFVRKMSESVSRSFNAWNQAKKENRFSLFENELAELVDLKKEETEILMMPSWMNLKKDVRLNWSISYSMMYCRNCGGSLKKHSRQNLRMIHFFLNPLIKKDNGNMA
jgi:carboxypeptidase Taq